MLFCFDFCLAARCAHLDCLKKAPRMLFVRAKQNPRAALVLLLLLCCWLLFFVLFCFVFLAIERRAGRHTTTLEVQRCRMAVSAVQTAALGHHGHVHSESSGGATNPHPKGSMK